MTTWTNAASNTSTYIMPLTFAATTSLPPPPPAPPETPLQWLNREIEKTCALAR